MGVTGLPQSFGVMGQDTKRIIGVKSREESGWKRLEWCDIVIYNRIDIDTDIDIFGLFLCSWHRAKTLGIP